MVTRSKGIREAPDHIPEVAHSAEEKTQRTSAVASAIEQTSLLAHSKPPSPNIK